MTHHQRSATMDPKITWPLARNRIRRGLINHTFGMVRRNANGTRRPHQGWDFEARDGTPCFAVADGKIAHVLDGGDYGKQVILRFEYDHDGDGDRDTLFALYAHLSKIEVAARQTVTKGQRLGLTGSTGNARGMGPLDQHLHFELRSQATPGRGLVGRFSPLAIFGTVPLHEALSA